MHIKESIKHFGKHTSYFPETYEYHLPGAGQMRVTRHNTHSTGGIAGFGVDINFATTHGWTGGVLPNDEARLLAENILKVLNGIDD